MSVKRLKFEICDLQARIDIVLRNFEKFQNLEPIWQITEIEIQHNIKPLAQKYLAISSSAALKLILLT